MKKQLTIIASLFLVLFSGGCTSVKTLVINTQEPASIILPQSIKTIGIVNNALPQPQTWGHYKFEYTTKGEIKEINIPVVSDNNVLILANSLFESLIDINHFDSISIYNIPLRTDSAFDKGQAIPPTTIQKIVSQTNTDALLSIDRFLIQSIRHQEYYDYTTAVNYLDMKMDVLFRIYSLKGESISPPIEFSDSIYWTSTYQGKRLLSDDSIPQIQEANQQAIYYMADKIAQMTIPKWIDETRIYYGDNKTAVKEFEGNNLEKAEKLWLNDFEHTNNAKRKARTAMNIALTFELRDYLVEALKWADKASILFKESAQTSLDYMKCETAEDYKTRLTQRIKEFKILDIGKKD